MKPTHNDYILLASEAELSKEIYKEKLSNAKQSLNAEYKRKHKNTFKILRIILIVAFLFNIGAMIITNILVAKNNPGRVVTEANGVQCAANNFSCHPEWKQFFFAILFQLSAYALLIYGYIKAESEVINKKTYLFLFVFIIFISVFMVYDFANDLGILIGKILFG